MNNKWEIKSEGVYYSVKNIIGIEIWGDILDSIDALPWGIIMHATRESDEFAMLRNIEITLRSLRD